MRIEDAKMTNTRQARFQPRTDLRTLLAYCTERDTLMRSIKTALVVGTILALINHWMDILSGQFSPRWIVPMLITYLVPFMVATYGQVQGKRQHDALSKVAAVS